MASRRVELWSDSYNAVLNDIFAVQSDIALTVSHSLNVTLASAERNRLELVPTSNVEAYTFYLQGNDYFNRNEWDYAVRMYEKAIAADSEFAQAYAGLSRSHSLIYWNYIDRSKARSEAALGAAEKALVLNPDLAESHLALGRYYYRIHLNYDKAIREYELALQISPNNSDILYAVGSVQRRKGQWDSAVDYFKRSADLDPRSTSKLLTLADTYGYMRYFDEAERLYRRVLSLAPDNPVPFSKLINLELSFHGDIDSASAIFGAAPENVRDQLIDDRLLLLMLGKKYDSARSLVNSNRQGSFYTRDSALYQLQSGELFMLANEPAQSRACYDSARVILENVIKKKPDEAQYHSMLAVAFGGLGDSTGVHRESKEAMNLCPVSVDALSGSNWLFNSVVAFVLLGDSEEACHRLSFLLANPSVASSNYFRIHPTFRSLVNSECFANLVSEAGNSEKRAN